VARPRPSPLRIYADTSVFGGCFDAEFQEHSRRFFDLARRGHVLILISELVDQELERAPSHVREQKDSLPKRCVRAIRITDEVRAVRDAYLAARIVGSRSRDDAAHVAAATVARASAIVSWNFKHIVSLDRIRGYNRVNLGLGYGMLTSLTPQSVLRDEEA
jgi:predicted nucleic acid-binding protein